MKVDSKMKRPGVMVAGIFCLGAVSVALLRGAGAVPVENFSPQGAMQADLNAGGHSVTNAATISATNVVVSGTLTAANLGSAATNSASAFAPATGSTNYIQRGNVSAGARTALVNATAGAGSQLVVGGLDSSNDLVISTSGTASSVILAPQAYVELPNAMLPFGPSGNILFVGDSLTAGVGIGGQAPFRNWSGQYHSYPDFFAEMGPGFNATPFNFGVSGDRLNDAINRFTGSTGTSTSTGSTTCTTAGTSTLSVASLSGISIGMGVASSSGDVPFGTTITGTSTGAIVLSTAATGTHTSETLYFCTPNTFGTGTSFTSAGWLVSNFITGKPTWVILNIGTNDYTVDGLAYTGSATTGSGTITGMAVMSWSPVSNLSSAAGDNVWGVTSTGTISLGTVSSATSSSLVVSNPSAVTSSMTSFRICPPITAWAGSYTSFVSSLVGYGDKVMVSTIMPFGNYDTQAEAYYGFNCNRLLMNAWISSTYASNAVAGVTFADVGNIPQLQYGANYDYFRSTTQYPHLNDQGYEVEATFLATQFAANYPGVMQGFINPFTESGSAASAYAGTGMPRAWLPGNIVFADTGTYTFGSGSLLAGLGSFSAGSGTFTGNLATGNIFWGSYGSSSYISATNHEFVVSDTGTNVPVISSNKTGGNVTAAPLQLFNGSASNWEIPIVLAGAASATGYGLEINYYYGSSRYAFFGVNTSTPYGWSVFNDGDISNVHGTDGGDALDITGTGSFTSTLKTGGSVNIGATQTMVAGSTAGSAVFSEPLAGASFKEVVIFLNNLSGTASYTFPAAFTNTPVVMNSDAAVTLVSATSVTVTGSGTTRAAILEGY